MNVRQLGVGVVATLVLVAGAALVLGSGPSAPAEQPQSLQQPAQNEIGASFDVTNLSAPESAASGDTITVTADIINPTDDPMVQDVDFRVDGEVVARQALALNAGETNTVTFEVDTTGLSGEYVHGVYTQDHGEIATISIEGEGEPAETETPGEETESPAGEETESPIGNETESPAGEETETPFGEETESPAGEETESPAGEETGSPAGEETESPAGEETGTPMGEETGTPTEAP